MSTDDYMEWYMANDMKKLCNLVDRILYKHRAACEALGVCQMDYDDLYSNASFTLWKVCEIYNGEGNFEALLYKSLENKILSYFTGCGRDKAMPKQRNSDGKKIHNEDGNDIFLKMVSLNAPMDTTDTEDSLIDSLQSEYDLENDVTCKYGFSPKVEAYLKLLSPIEREILGMIADGYKPCEIQKMLHITQREYTDYIKSIHAYEKISVLF